MIDICKEGDSAEEKAKKFIDAIKKLNKSMDIPQKVKGILKSDIPLMAERALSEGNPLYPVLKIMSKEEMLNMYKIIKE